jgi:hypothetical protein
MTNEYLSGPPSGNHHRELPFTSPWVRVLARVRATSLDTKLASGDDPTTSDVLSVRAQQLVSPALRHTVAKSWLDLALQAHVPFSRFTSVVRFERRRILSVEPEIHELAHALEGPLPRVRGVAMALSLLRDGAGPVFNPANSTNLSSALREAIANIDPLAPAS